MAFSNHLSPSELHDTVCTNRSSKFKPISIKLSNGATITGLLFLPQSLASESSQKPLVVAIHGATCSAYIFDLEENTSAAKHAETLNLPFLAINRPNYLDSTGWLVDHSEKSSLSSRLGEGLTYFEEEGYWLHQLILPAIWQELALPNNLSSLVSISHSMAVPPTIIACGLYGSEEQEKRAYEWSGICLYGYAEKPTQTIQGAAERSKAAGDSLKLPMGFDPNIHMPPFTDQDRVDLMAGPLGIHDPAIAAFVRQQQTPFNIGELQNMFAEWPQQKLKYMPMVKLPVLYSLGEYDYIWVGDQANVNAFCGGFSNAPRLEGALVRGAPHAVDLGKHVGPWWWMRVLSWAVEVAIGDKLAAQKIPHYT